MRSPLADALAGLGRALGRLRVRWYLFGAQAALLYGAARLTADVDVTVQLGDRRTAELVRALEKAGFRLRVRDVGEFVAKTRVLPFLHPRSGMPIDVVLAGPGLEDLFFQRRRRRTVDGVPVPVASPEDIVVMKALAGRGKDDDDVVAILAAQPKLDLAWVRRTLHTLERALDQSDLSSRFEKLLVRARRRDRRSRRDAG
ncbi:MAG: DUF6036 family nucleotidyltransferase, partial [Burkholderiales bacterium]